MGGSKGSSMALPGALASRLAPVNVVVGHYGVGKTNFCLNLALDAAGAGFDAVLVDLDVVNPYFRSTEYRGILEAQGVKVVAPVFAEVGTSLDVPSLTGAVVPAIEDAYRLAAEATALATEAPAPVAGEGAPQGMGAPGCAGAAPQGTRPRVVIIDVGGDDAGATALGRFARTVAQGPHEVWCVVNAFRNLTQDVQDACDVLADIEAGSHLAVTGIVGNAHLKADTDAAVIARGASFAREVSERTGLPLVCVTAPKPVVSQTNGDFETLGLLERDTLYPVDSLVRTPWEKRA